MSTVTHVPETHELNGDDARKTLAQAKVTSVATDAAIRFRYADGFSFARAIAFQLVLTVIPGVIFLVALSVRLGESRLSSVLRGLIETLAPGPAGDMFRQAFEQGSTAGSTGNTIAIAAGALALLIGAVTGMSQVQRGASRIYGVDSDRPTIKRYALATALALTAGVLLTAAFFAIALGSSVASSLAEEPSAQWALVRWPIGLLALVGGLTALFKVSPNRKQPAMSWLATGAAMSVVGWALVSVLLSLYLNASGTFGETYGPLAGVMGLMLWAQLSAIAILYGLAFAAQLEAVRVGVHETHCEDTDAPVLNDDDSSDSTSDDTSDVLVST